MPSSTIARFEYDAQERTLSIWFISSGRRYDYFGVPRDLVEEFRASISKGRFFNERIRDRYASEWQAWEHGSAPASVTEDGGSGPATEQEPATPAEPSGSNVIPFPTHRRRS